MRSEILTVTTGDQPIVMDLTDDCARFVHGAAGHGRDHVLPAFIAPSVTLPILDGQLQLGTWQSICLVDTNIDNRQRSVQLSFLEG